MKKENKRYTYNDCSNCSKTLWKFEFIVSELVVGFGEQYVESQHCAIWFSLFIKWSQFQADYWEILRKIDWRRECVETSQTWGARPAWRFWIVVGKNISIKTRFRTSQDKGMKACFWTQLSENFNQETLGFWQAKYF